MDLEQLKTFDRIARDLSFTKAAAALNVTQATVSMRMRALEDLLGATLFNRGRQVTLTDQGMTFLPYARRILGTAQEGREALRRVERGRVTVGLLRTMVAPLITEPLLRFQHNYPGIDVVVTEGRHTQIIAMLHEREVELGIVCWPNIDPLCLDLEPLVVMRERAPLVVSAAVAARLGPSPSIDEVLAIVPQVISLFWWQVEPDRASALCRRGRSSVELPVEPALRLVERGQGVGYFLESSVREGIAAGRLAEISPPEFGELYRDTALVVRSKSVLERPMLRDFALELARDFRCMGRVIEDRLGEDVVRAA